MQGPADGDVPLVGQRDGREDGATEGDVVEGIDDEGERVDEDLAGPLKRPAMKRDQDDLFVTGLIFKSSPVFTKKVPKAWFTLVAGCSDCCRGLGCCE